MRPDHTSPAPRYIPADDAADVLCVATQTLANWRAAGRGPAYTRIGRAIRYEVGALTAWAQARTITPGTVAEAGEQ
ncbi:MAG: helix-turn-helix domain-containing protein [Planctomycetota bacterium]|nr:helix-turn-helix domain-containing protein [Planctomycetota bacterium]